MSGPVPPINGNAVRVGPAASDGELARDERHFLDYLRVLSKRRWTAIPAFVVVFIALIIPTFISTPLYEASAQLLIEAESQNVISFKEVVDQERATNDYYQTQYKILESRALARATIDSLQLWDHPQFNGGVAPAAKSTGALGKGLAVGKRVYDTAVSRIMGLFDSAPPARPAASASATAAAAAATASAVEETTTQSRAIREFLDALTIAPVRNSRLVDIKFRSPDPKLAASLANALAKAYIQRNLEFKFMASKEASEWLGSQLEDQRQSVESTELAVQKFREQNDAVSTGDPQVMQKLGDLNSAVTRAKTERIQKEAAFRQLESVNGNTAGLDTMPAILSNGFIQQLKQQVSELERTEAQQSQELGVNNPDLIKTRLALQSTRSKLNGEIANVVQAVRNEYVMSQAQENSLTRALDAQKAEALALDRKAIGYRALERDAASNRQIFDALLQRTKETNISGDLKTNNIRIADEADVPSTPVFPRTQRNMLMAVFAGLGTSLFLAYGVEYHDNNINSPKEIRMHLGLQCVGLIPLIVTKAAKDTHAHLLNNGVPAVFAEAFRAVRTNVLFSFEGEGPRTLVITSTGPGEGKSLVASNLAVGLAMADNRVLLIDADMRRPRVNTIFAATQEPGLSDLIVGEAKAAEAIRTTAVPNLWILPAGRIPPNAAELLSAHRFNRLLSGAAGQFDWIILDSPPVLAVTDASILAHVADGVLFVVGAERTNRPTALKAVEQLESAKAKFVGAVLNGVDLKRNAFFYSQHYRREYSDYYGATAS